MRYSCSCLSQWHSTKRLVYLSQKICNSPPQRVIRQFPRHMMCHDLFLWENKPVYSISITPDLYWGACGKLSHPNQRQKYSHPIGWHATAQFNRPFQISLSSRLTVGWTSSLIPGVLQTSSQVRSLRRSHEILRASVFVFISKNGKATQITARGIEEGNSHYVTSDARGREFVILLPNRC